MLAIYIQNLFKIYFTVALNFSIDVVRVYTLLINFKGAVKL